MSVPSFFYPLGRACVELAPRSHRDRHMRSLAVRSGALSTGLATVVLLCIALVLHGHSSRVFDSRTDSVNVTTRPPQLVTAFRGQLLVRAGSHSHLVARGVSARWLSSGNVLLALKRPERDAHTQDVRLYDPVRGQFDGKMVADQSELPNDPLEGVAFLRDDRLMLWDLGLTKRRALTLPSDPAPAGGGGEVARSYSTETATVGSHTYVRFSEVADEEKTLKYGVLRIGDDGATDDVLVGQRITRLRVSRDGRALLGIQQHSGEPCGGCVVRQDLVEIDPATGRIVGRYGTPPGYAKQWRATRLDKVGTTVAVRYESICESGAATCLPTQFGTWTYDGEWAEVPGSARTETWWQGPDDRIVRRTDQNESSAPLYWLHDGTRTSLEGRLEGHNGAAGSIAGGLLRPASS